MGTKQCKTKASHHVSNLLKQSKTTATVEAALKASVEVCKAETKAKLLAAKAKAELKIRTSLKTKGPTFKFHTQPCKGGKGVFKKTLKLNERVNVGLIPAGVFNVKVWLKTKKDVDTELWSADGKTAIVGWRCHTKGCINSAFKKTSQWRDIKITYSGYFGTIGKTGYQFGNEYIHLTGKSKHAYMMKAYAYEAGTANIEYQWDKDEKACNVIQKERKAKAAVQAMLKKKASKKTLKVMVTSTKSCKTAKAEYKLYASRLKVLTQRVQKTKSELSICNGLKVKMQETVKKFTSSSSKVTSSASVKHSTSTSTSKTTKTGKYKGGDITSTSSTSSKGSVSTSSAGHKKTSTASYESGSSASASFTHKFTKKKAVKKEMKKVFRL